MEPAYDWSRFKIVYYYRSSRHAVYRAWSTSAGLESFFVARASYTKPDQLSDRNAAEQACAGDRFHWRWMHGYELQGAVLGANVDSRFEFTFGKMHVSIALTELDGQTELVLEQTDIGLTDPERVAGHLNCRSCWIFFLTNLKSVLEHGIDLRDKDANRVSSMEVGFEPISWRAEGNRTGR